MNRHPSSVPPSAPVARSFALRSPRDWLLAVGGPLVIGAVLGVEHGGIDIATRSATLPLLLAGVTLVMLPALYIATSLIGAAPPAREVGSAVLRGSRACGVVLLGLAGPVAFLLATSHSSVVTGLLGAVVTAAGCVAGLRVLFADLFGALPEKVRDPLVVRAVFAGWSLVALAIGARMYAQFMTA